LAPGSVSPSFEASVLEAKTQSLPEGWNTVEGKRGGQPPVGA
jgi:hypothetical protein